PLAAKVLKALSLTVASVGEVCPIELTVTEPLGAATLIDLPALRSAVAMTDWRVASKFIEPAAPALIAVLTLMLPDTSVTPENPLSEAMLLMLPGAMRAISPLVAVIVLP